MFLQSLFVVLGVSLSVHYISCEICHLTNPDVAAETDAAEVIFQGVASNNVTYNVSEETEVIGLPQNESDQAAVRFHVTRILKGKLRMLNIQWVSIAGDVVPVKDRCGSAITVGSKYLIFLRNLLLINPQNLTLPPTSVLSQEVVNLIVLSSKETVKLVLHKSMKTRISPPLAKLAERELSISAGMRIRLVCHASGYPIPVIRWYKNKILLFSDVRIQLISKSYESELVVLNAEPQDAGQYKCQASNRLGMSNAVRTIVHVTVADNIGNRSDGTRCVDDAFCFNHGRCFQTHVLGHRFCRCSPEFIGIRCAIRKSTSFAKVESLKKTEPVIFHSKIGVLVIVVAVVVLVSVSLIIMIANLARKLCQSRVDCYDDPVEPSLRQISPQFPHRSQVEITNLVFTEHTMSSVSNFGDSDSKRSLDLSADLSPQQEAVAKSKGDGIEDSFQNVSEKSVPIELEDDSDPGNRNYEQCIAGNTAYDSDNSDSCKWRLNNEQMSDLEVHRESDIDLVEVEPPSGDELYCPSRGLSEMSSRCDTTSRTSTSMDCESNSSADLSQRLLRHLYAFPQMGEPEQEREEQEEDMSLEEFLGQHCIAMGALPDLKDYLGTMAIDESLTGSYPGSKNFTSEV